MAYVIRGWSTFERIPPSTVRKYTMGYIARDFDCKFTLQNLTTKEKKKNHNASEERGSLQTDF